MKVALKSSDDEHLPRYCPGMHIKWYLATHRPLQCCTQHFIHKRRRKTLPDFTTFPGQITQQAICLRLSAMLCVNSSTESVKTLITRTLYTLQIHTFKQDTKSTPNQHIYNQLRHRVTISNLVQLKSIAGNADPFGCTPAGVLSAQHTACIARKPSHGPTVSAAAAADTRSANGNFNPHRHRTTCDTSDC